MSNLSTIIHYFVLCAVICPVLMLSTYSAALPPPVPTSQTVSAITNVRWQDGFCPVCSKKVSLAIVTPIGVVGGVDHDLFARAIGPQPEFYLINTCPYCHFSGYLADFELILPEDLKKDLKNRLVPSEDISPEASPREIDVLVKYDLAWQTSKRLGRSDESLAWLALRASWVARDQYCNIPRNDDLAKVLRKAGLEASPPNAKENPADREIAQAKHLEEDIIAGEIEQKDEWACHAIVGLLFRRHGLNDRAIRHINLVIGSDQAPKSVREAFLRMRKSIDDEVLWQGRSVECFEKALEAKKIDPKNVATAKYLVGQLYLRLGNQDKAKMWFREALRENDLPQRLREWIEADGGLVK
jgi:uncharacterized protein (DUF2225 family)